MASCTDESLAHAGWTYLLGNGVEQDFDHALTLFKQAWEQHDIAACGLIGWMYLQGLGVERDVEKALHHLTQARMGGDAASCGVLAGMYLDGDGVERNLDETLRLFHDARTGGLRAASRMLGVLYLDGIGVPQDLQMACQYLSEASQLGDAEASELLDSVANVCVPIVSLAGLRDGHPMSCGAAQDALAKRGFCWLAMDDDALEKVRPAELACKSFLQGSGCRAGVEGALIGHFQTKYKDGIRIMTGDQMQEGCEELPIDLKANLHRLAAGLDAVQTDIVQQLSPFLGGDCAEAVGQAANIALLSQASPRYGILDCILYQAQSRAMEVVSPHTDPGLLILALPSDPGLQLRDEGGRWLAPPKACGTLWAGRAARNCPPAVHRVSVSQQPRFAIWHELCTRTQLAPPMLRQLDAQSMELKFGSVRGTQAVLSLFQKTEDHAAVPEQLMESISVPSATAPKRAVLKHERLALKMIKGISSLKLEPSIVKKPMPLDSFDRKSNVEPLDRFHRKDDVYCTCLSCRLDSRHKRHDHT
mmetsp:Transcript_98390/g.195075  ORF Transcript_98390/g.195075 Transcript_98390/m.195075 type:complete len:532 (+) Transcript_98390:76-1671(+)